MTTTLDLRQEIDQLDQEEQTEIIRLAETGMPIKQVLKKVEAQFWPRYRELVFPQAHVLDPR